MRLGNVDLRVFREVPCVDSHGRRIKGDCPFEVLGDVICVRYTPPSSAQLIRAGLTEQSLEFLREYELASFRYHSQDQETIINIKKDDYVAFYMGGEAYYYKVIRVTGRPAFRFANGECLSYSLIGERLEPRDCPKPLISQYSSDDLPDIDA